MNSEFNFQEIQNALNRISIQIMRTPVYSNQHIDKVAKSSLVFKCENLQTGGSFKYRGALNAILTLPDSARAKGVATHSSGNHGTALALAAASLKIPAYIVMPETAPEVKIKNVREAGGKITFSSPRQEDRERVLKEVIAQTGAAFVHPSNDPMVIAGQGTSALELLQEVPDLECLLTPVGGGGLLSGSLLAGHGINPGLKVYGAEPLAVNDAWLSIQKGSIQPPTGNPTLADGLMTSLGSETFPVIRDQAADILLVTEEEIRRALYLLAVNLNQSIEPSSAVPFAAVLKYPDLFRGKKTGIILSGGNVDKNRFPEIWA